VKNNRCVYTGVYFVKNISGVTIRRRGMTRSGRRGRECARNGERQLGCRRDNSLESV